MSMLMRFLQMARERQDLVFAVFFVFIVAMLIFPLPTWLVDTLLAVNLTLSLMVLITATYLKHPLELSTFPALILMTSILRVSLSVATTRLILAYGDAGHLIMAFGQFVIGGNIVVGLVIFLIIAIVQFMVVTKGAERISEVGARFTLDAMPGKQMAIDNDLRAGDITKEEAKRRRDTLGKESQFHGAMDGAMRFVKGDAIAALIIVFINMLGGITIGMAQRGMAFGEAGRLYVLLSVGDALIAQIPAMFIALAAGTIVTRVTTSDDKNLGQDITQQLGAQPRALGVAGVASVLMGFIPGFPMVVFFILGGLLLTATWFMTRPPPEPTPLENGFTDGEDMPTDIDMEPAPLRPQELGDVVTILGHPDFLNLLRYDDAYEPMERRKAEFLRRMGFPPPPLGFGLDEEIPPGDVIVEIDGVAVERFNVPGFTPGARMTREQSLASAEGVARVRLRHASALFGVPEAARWLETVQIPCGRLADDVQQLLPFMLLVDSLRLLLDDGIGLTPPRLVLEGLAHASQRAQDAETITEVVRGFMRRQICHIAADGGRVIDAHATAPMVDGLLRQIGANDLGPQAARDGDRALAQFIEAARRASEEAGRRIVVITPADVRRIAQKQLVQARIDAFVVSWADIAQDYQVRTAGVLAADQPQAA
jgi:type III secretion protein V